MKTIHIDYYGLTGAVTHGYDESWEKAPWFCPHCGKQDVFSALGDGDYYVGVQLLCLSCNHGFYLPDNTFDESRDEQGKQRLAQLKA
jgi:hypothetical protein